MAEDLRRQAAIADILAERQAYEESLRQSPSRQKVLLSGMDCLEGQQDLFATDGPPDMTKESGVRLRRLGPECLPPEIPGKARRAPLCRSENG